MIICQDCGLESCDPETDEPVCMWCGVVIVLSFREKVRYGIIQPENQTCEES